MTSALSPACGFRLTSYPMDEIIDFRNCFMISTSLFNISGVGILVDRAAARPCFVRRHYLGIAAVPE